MLSIFKILLLSLLLPSFNAEVNFYDRESASATLKYKVDSLPHISILDKVPYMFAGTIDNNNFWLFREEHNLKDKLIIWFGIEESIKGMGPFTVSSKGFQTNENTWLKEADLLFIDIDLQAYFSDTDYNFWDNFFNQFLSTFSYYKNKDLYLAGEGIIGGQLIPTIANSILENSVNVDGMLINNDFKYINLRGIVLENGNFDPVSQSQSLIQFGQDNSLLNTETSSKYSAYLDSCNENMNCFVLAAEMFLNISRPTASTCYNRFNYNDDTQSFPDCGLSKNSASYQFFQDQDILSKLHFENAVRYIASGDSPEQLVSSIISSEYSASSQYLDAILNKVPVYVYNSNEDITVNYIGVRNTINPLGGESFSSMSLTSLKLRDQFVAQFKSQNSLALVEVPQSSKWVNCDMPDLARALIHSFIFIEKFDKVSKAGTTYYVVPNLASDTIHPDFITILSIGIVGVYTALGYAIYKKLFVDAEPIFTNTASKFDSNEIKAVNSEDVAENKINPFEHADDISENPNICDGVEGVGEADFANNNKTIDVDASIEKMKMKYKNNIPYNNFNIPTRSNTTVNSLVKPNIVKQNSSRIIPPSRQGSSFYQRNSYISVYKSDYAPSTLLDPNDSILQDMVSFVGSDGKESQSYALENPFNNVIPEPDDHYTEDNKFFNLVDDSITENTPLQSDVHEGNANVDDVYDNRHSLKEYLKRKTVVR